MSDTVSAYDAQAGILAERYESTSAEAVHAALREFIPRGQDLIALDVGAGSGRDAAWLASLGYEVVAAEPAAGMRSEAQRRHPDPRIRWLDDRLPDLAGVHRLGLAFDLILLSAVWMHVPLHVRGRAFRKLSTLLKPGGVILMSLRDGPSEPDRPMWPAPAGEIEAFARTHGLAVLRSVTTPDQLGRTDVLWTGMCLRLPDNGAKALPLLRGVILSDEKSSTYKLGLLRAVARVADATPALATPRLDEDAVEIPLGIVALNWIRMYLPLVTAGLPQMPGNSGPDGLGFAKEGFRALMGHNVVSQDLRIGAQFVGERAAAMARALSEARLTIADMPANYTRFPNSDVRVFQATPATPTPLQGRAEPRWRGARRLRQSHRSGPRLANAPAARVLGRAGPGRRMGAPRALLWGAHGAADRSRGGRGSARMARPSQGHSARAISRQADARQRAGAELRLDRSTASRRHARHRSLPTLVGLALQRPVELAAGLAAGEPASQAGSPALRTCPSRRAGKHHCLVAGRLVCRLRPAHPLRAGDHGRTAGGQGRIDR
jgi:SAM-dependent methyltransferase